jgi:hypothetical protein
MGWPSGGYGFLGVKTRKVPADDLFGTVIFDVLRPGIPREDISLPINEKNGVIPNPSHELCELLLLLKLQHD